MLVCDSTSRRCDAILLTCFGFGLFLCFFGLCVEDEEEEEEEEGERGDGEEEDEICVSVLWFLDDGFQISALPRKEGGGGRGANGSIWACVTLAVEEVCPPR